MLSKDRKQPRDTKRIIFEILLFAAAFLIIGYFLQKHVPNIMKLLSSGNDVSAIEDYLEAHGKEGKILLVLLQVVETISIVFPATPVYISAGILFGKVQGVLVCYVTNLILNLLIFQAARRISGLTHHTTDIRKQKYIGRFIETAKHMDRVVLAMCLLPIVPNGMIPYMSAQTRVTTPEFLRALAVGSLPSIIAYVCCGDILISDSYKIVIPIIIVLVVLSCLAFIFRKYLIKTVEPKVVAFIEG